MVNRPAPAPAGPDAPAGGRPPARRLPTRPLTVLGAAVLGVVVAVLFVYPTVMVVVGAFRTSSPGFPGSWSVQGFVDAYTDPATYQLFWNSTAYSLSVTTISLVLAVFFAWMVTQTNTPGRHLVTPMMIALIALPFLFFGISWAMLGNAEVGLLNQVLRLVVPVESGPLDVRSWPGIVFVAALKITAINYMLMLGVFRALDPALREASLVAGVGRVGTFFRVELPVLAPVLLALALMGFVRGLESFDVPLLLGSPAGIEVFSTQIYNYLSNHFPPAYAQASALSVLVMAVMAVLVVLMWRFLGRRDFTTLGGKGQRVELVDLGGRKYLCTAAIVAYALLALAFPLLQLVFGSLQTVFGVPTSGLTLDHYDTVLGEPGIVSALWNTALVVVVGGLAAVALATLIAYLVQRTTRGCAGSWRARRGCRGPCRVWCSASGCCGPTSRCRCCGPSSRRSGWSCWVCSSSRRRWPCGWRTRRSRRCTSSWRRRPGCTAPPGCAPWWGWCCG
ncbi:hypothetical protein BJF78_11775 [Pseudonocardia sp. CNS-139]|nr:hypothetical protein BJF78_11775 [Pseudonocardia sp. CNS-139]